jgi:purine-binding chemotaxis protein CheW
MEPNPENRQARSPSEELADLARQRAAASTDGPGPASSEPALTLLYIRVGRRWFGIRSEMVREVTTKGHVTRVPTAPTYVLGVTLIRGRLVPVLALEGLLGAVGAGETAQTLPRLVVLRHGETEIGLVADETRGVVEQRVSASAEVVLSPDRPRWLGAEIEWEGKLVCLLDVPALLAEATPGEPAGP